MSSAEEPYFASDMPDRPKYTGVDYPHSLFTVIEGKVVSLEGHLEDGLESVIWARYQERGLEHPTGTIIRLANSPEELAEK